MVGKVKFSLFDVLGQLHSAETEPLGGRDALDPNTRPGEGWKALDLAFVGPPIIRASSYFMQGLFLVPWGHLEERSSRTVGSRLEMQTSDGITELHRQDCRERIRRST